MSILPLALARFHWRELARLVARDCIEDDLLGRSAQLSYYFLLAVFPFLLILTTVLGFMAQTGSEILDGILEYVGRFAPPSAYELLLSTLKEIRAGAGGGKLSIGIIGTLWASSMGVNAIIDGLNRAYDIQEGRPWWRVQVLAIGLTLGLGGFVVVAIVIIIYGSELAHFLAGRMGIQDAWIALWNVIHWPLATGVLIAAFMIIYKYGPDLKAERWRRTLPGALTAAALWLCASIGLRIYLRMYNTYNATYGSLGAVIILMLWFYLSAAAILIGGEVNSEIENAGDDRAHRSKRSRD